MTPVAELEPVLLAGTTVKRASLHNADELERKDIRVGDAVVIQKAGEIIPQVVRVETDARKGTETRFHFPKTCPSCGAPVERSGDEVDYYCTNPPSRCPDQLKEWLRWYAHRDAMDIDGLGEKLIDQLVDKKLVKSLADLYRLDAPTLAELERMGKKSADNLVQATRGEQDTGRSTGCSPGLTIRHVGTRMAEIIAGGSRRSTSCGRCRWRSSRRSPRSARSSRPAFTIISRTPRTRSCSTTCQDVGVSPEPLQPVAGQREASSPSPARRSS